MDLPAVVLQCVKCRDNYRGRPTDGHQCYRQMQVDLDYCLDSARPGEGPAAAVTHTESQGWLCFSASARHCYADATGHKWSPDLSVDMQVVITVVTPLYYIYFILIPQSITY